LSNGNWHSHEARILQELKSYFEPKGYKTATHRYFDSFDLILAKTKDSSVSELIGIEIKSDKDQLEKLNDQLINYINLFDKVYIAVENKNIPENLPPFVGIIRLNNMVKIEKEAGALSVPAGTFITKSAIQRTIKMSGGIKKRSNELILYIEQIETVKKKLIYNTLFYDETLPFTPDENVVVDFIIRSSSNELRTSGMFIYEFGDIKIGEGKTLNNIKSWKNIDASNQRTK